MGEEIVDLLLSFLATVHRQYTRDYFIFLLFFFLFFRFTFINTRVFLRATRGKVYRYFNLRS